MSLMCQQDHFDTVDNYFLAAHSFHKGLKDIIMIMR